MQARQHHGTPGTVSSAWVLNDMAQMKGVRMESRPDADTRDDLEAGRSDRRRVGRAMSSYSTSGAGSAAAKGPWSGQVPLLRDTIPFFKERDSRWRRTT